MPSPDPGTLLHNLGAIASILQTISLLMGIAMFMGGIFLMKKFGESRTFMSNQMTVAAPLMMLVSGVFLMMLPTTVSTFLYAFWSTSSPIQYTGTSGGWDEYIPVVIMFARLIGIAAMMKGVVMMSRMGGHHSQPGNLGKALIFILCGIMLVHIMGTCQLLEQILNIS
jgi:intracellular multiplication protein IcmC